MSTDAINKYPEIHQQLAAAMAAVLIEQGMDEAGAAAMAERLKERIRKDFGGVKIYIPTTRYTVDYIRAEILRRWNGTNTLELCREFEIAESRLRQLAEPFPSKPWRVVGT